MARGEGGSGGTAESGRASPAPSFQPEQIFAVLRRHGVEFVLIGAFAAVLQGWNEPTGDVDITPLRDVENLRRLADALREMDAKVLTADGDVDESWPIDDQHLRLRDTTFLTTRFGNVDVVVNPAAADGYPDLARDAILARFPGGVEIRVARLVRIIESKRASDRPKDRAALPSLELLARERYGERS